MVTFLVEEENKGTEMDYITSVLSRGLVMNQEEVNYTHAQDIFKLFMRLAVLGMKSLVVH